MEGLKAGIMNGDGVALDKVEQAVGKVARGIDVYLILAVSCLGFLDSFSREQASNRDQASNQARLQGFCSWCCLCVFVTCTGMVSRCLQRATSEGGRRGVYSLSSMAVDGGGEGDFFLPFPRHQPFFVCVVSRRRLC